MTADHRALAAAAVLGGVLLGALDFVWIRFVPAPLGQLGNSSAVWAVAACGFGWFWARCRWAPATAGAVVLLVLAVPSYYVAAALIQDDDYAVLWAPASLLWMGFAVLAGVVFGTAGVLSRTGTGWWRVIGSALPGAVLFAEATLLARRIGDPNYGSEPFWPAVVTAVLGVLVIVAVTRGARRRVAAVAAAAPLAALGFAAFTVAGFR
jgi:hypothetical protein